MFHVTKSNRIAYFLLAVLMTALLSGCGSPNPASAERLLLTTTWKELIVVDEAGHIQAQYDLPAWDAKWSPDGSKIAFWEPESEQLGIFDEKTGKTIQLLAALPCVGLSGNPSLDWSPDGRHLAFTGMSEDKTCQLFVVNADGTSTEPLAWPCEDECSSPDWLSDNTHVTFLEGLIVQDSRIFSRIKRVNTQTGELVTLFEIERDNRAMRWSPDNSQLALSSRNYDVFLRKTVDSESQLPIRADTDLCWFPSGERIAMSSRDKFSYIAVYIYDIGTKQTQRVYPPEPSLWSPAEIHAAFILDCR